MSRTFGSIVWLTLILTCHSVPIAEGQTAQKAVRALDGIFTERERSSATHAILSDGGSFFVQREDGILRVTVESEPIGVASLCIGTRNRVQILHASAALGALEFRPREADWATDDKFSWTMRNTSMSEEAIAERAVFYESHGWVATTAAMGDPGTTEFLVLDDPEWNDGVHLAVGVMPIERPDVTLALPATARACADPGLVRGYDPKNPLRFRLSEWLHIDA